jgi:integrase
MKGSQRDAAGNFSEPVARLMDRTPNRSGYGFAGSVRQISRLFKETAREAGITKPVTLHTLRHSSKRVCKILRNPRIFFGTY